MPSLDGDDDERDDERDEQRDADGAGVGDRDESELVEDERVRDELSRYS